MKPTRLSVLILLVAVQIVRESSKHGIFLVGSLMSIDLREIRLPLTVLTTNFHSYSIQYQEISSRSFSISVF